MCADLSSHLPTRHTYNPLVVQAASMPGLTANARDGIGS